jgi:flagellar hook-associated protein 3 FlgL
MGSIGIGRTSDFAQHQTTLGHFSRVQRDLADLQNQISSGQRSRNFKGLVGDVEEFVNVEASVKKTKAYLDNNSETLVRMRTIRTGISNTVNIVDNMQDLVGLRRNGALADNLAFEQQWKGMIAAVANELNVNIEGRYLFSGTRTDKPPIVNPPPAPGELGTPDISYYQGSGDNYITRPQDRYEIELDVRGDDPAIQMLYNAYHLGIEAHATNDDDLLDDTLTAINAALDGIITMQTRMDAKIVEVERINDSHEARRLYFQSVADEIGSVDVVEATTQLSLDQTILTASFQAFARISSLSLSDYLN